MTPAAYKTLRESLGLSAQAAARFHGLTSDRTIRYWESPDGSVPDGAAAQLMALDAAIDAAAGQLVKLAGDLSAEYGRPETIEIKRYLTREAWADSPHARQVPFESHGALVDRGRRRLEAAGYNVEIVYA